ncbi:hypothetical protein CCFV1_ORF048 [Cotesia congregata filamentous virus 1]|uniref:Uncharacterized protein n=1 Tax=Cotesia congregata filamentous virus 1 TaxID=3064291 RepID=A0ABC8QJM4_9VIRU|nr:hypothetical protein CCFV1_ORF048 [Cotesia congregata filamentous virus 1]
MSVTPRGSVVVHECYPGFFIYDRDWSYMSVTLSIPGFFIYDHDRSYMSVTPPRGEYGCT